MSLLLLLGGGAGGGGAVAGTADGEASSRIVFLDPARVARAIVYDHVAFDCEPAIYEQGTFEITVSNRSTVWTTTYGGSTAAAVEWRNWSFDYYHRGVKVFSGPVVGVSIASEANTGMGVLPIAFARLRCVTWTVWFLGSRVIETTDGSNWFRNATPWDDIARELVKEQLVAGSVLTPTNYPAATTRSNCGPFTVTVEANASDASLGDVSYQTGKPLLDTLMELCSMPTDLDADGLYPRMVETATPGTFQFRIETGRGGAGRQIGSDLTGSIQLSAHMGTVNRTKYDVDHLAKVAVAGVSGTGRVTSRKRSYVKLTEVYSIFGAREDQIDLPAATAVEDRINEANRILNESGLMNTRTLEFDVQEKSGQYFGPDIELRDSVKIGEVTTGQVFSQMLVGAKIHATSPEPPSVRYIMGTLPKNATRDAQRSGGGGKGGGRRGGGTPKDSDGQSEVDPDTIKGWSSGEVDRGTSPVVADEPNDQANIQANTVARGGDQTYPNISVYGVDPGAAAGSVERFLIGVVGTEVVIRVCPFRWWPVEFDTNADGAPDVVRYIPTYEEDTGPPDPGCGDIPPPPTE